MVDVVIVGGGVMGLMLAYELGQLGAAVTVLEQDSDPRRASWAGGGILSPLPPWEVAEALMPMVQYSQRAYPGLAQTLLSETGIDVEWTPCGLLALAPKDDKPALHWARQHGHTVQRLSGQALAAREPKLAETITEGLWFPDIAQIRNPRLLQALRQASPRVRHITGCQAHQLMTLGERVVGIKTQGETIIADHVVVAAGAWSAALLAPLSITLPVSPVKGQMLLLSAAPGTLEHIVLHKRFYAIPRRDGHILIGSTVEQTGFDDRITTTGYHTLRQALTEMLPDVANCPVIRHWAALRPATKDLPLIGRLPRYNNLYINSGHYRNGLLLAPASAQLLVDYLLGNQPVIPWQMDNASKSV